MASPSSPGASLAAACRKTARSVLFCQRRAIFVSLVLMLLITVVYYGTSFRWALGCNARSISPKNCVSDALCTFFPHFQNHWSYSPQPIYFVTSCHISVFTNQFDFSLHCRWSPNSVAVTPKRGSLSSSLFPPPPPRSSHLEAANTVTRRTKVMMMNWWLMKHERGRILLSRDTDLEHFTTQPGVVII